MFLSVTYTLSEVKESLSSSVLVSTNHLQTRCSGSPVVGSYPDFSMFFGTSVSGSKVKHLYGYLHPFNTSIVLIVVFFVYCLAVEITSGSVKGFPCGVVVSSRPAQGLLGLGDD